MAVNDSMAVMARAVTARAKSWRHALLITPKVDAAPRDQPLPVRRIVTQAVGLWLVTRVVFLLITLLGRTYNLIPAAPTGASIFPMDSENVPLLLPLLVNHSFLASWVHWDASWYLLIGTHGYDVFPTGATNFFPLYPLCIHLLTLVFGQQSVVPAALALSNVAALAAFIGLGLLAAHEAPREDTAEAPARLIRVTAAYPFAFFLFAPYTEAFFLAFAVFCLLCARRGWWRWAAVCAFLAGLTRPTALALVPALAWEYGRQHGLWRRTTWQHAAWRSMRWLRTLASGAVVIAAMPLGLVSYFVYLKLRFGGYLLPLRAQTVYHHHVTWPVWQTLAVLFQRFFNPPPWTPEVALLYIDGALLLLFTIITVLNVRRLPLLYTLYMLATLFLLLISPVPDHPEVVASGGRYLLMAVPVFMVISRWIRKRPGLEMPVVVGGFMLQALFALFFATGGWVE